MFHFKNKRLIKWESFDLFSTDRGNGARLLCLYTERTRSNAHELEKGKSLLLTGKKFFVVRVVGQWNRLSKVLGSLRCRRWSETNWIKFEQAGLNLRLGATLKLT